MSGLLQKLKARNRVEAVLIAGKRSDGEAIHEAQRTHGRFVLEQQTNA